MDIRQPIHSEHARTLDTDGLRRHFLVEVMFAADAMTLTYSQIDRIIVGGIMPMGKSVTFGESLAKHTGTSYFLERRELGLINIGGAAKVVVDGTTFDLGPREALYIGSGAKAVEFSSVSAQAPAKLYFNCAPAHTSYPHKKVTLAEASPETLGAPETSNRRTIYKFLVPDVLPTCQLQQAAVVGIQILHQGIFAQQGICHGGAVLGQAGALHQVGRWTGTGGQGTGRRKVLG